MKKIYILFLILIIMCMGSAFAEPSITGDFSLSGNLIIDNNFNTSVNSDALLDLFLSSKSNNVKYTIKSATTIDTTSALSTELEQAYLQFRIPFNENYLIFNTGKVPLDIGGDWEFNSGTPFDINADNPWIASMKIKLLQLPDFKSLNMELILKLPIEDLDSKVGSRITYDINNKYFGTFEASILTDLDNTILSGGLNGSLFFDYGLYAKTDLQNITDFEVSFFLLRIISDYTLKFEAMYDNDIETLYLLPSIQISPDSKTSLIGVLSTTYNNSNFSFIPLIYANLNIVQGLDATVGYSYNSITKHAISTTITHKF